LSPIKVKYVFDGNIQCMGEVIFQVLLLEAYFLNTYSGKQVVFIKSFTMFIPFSQVITFLAVCPKKVARNSDHIIFKNVHHTVVCIIESLKIN